MLQDEVVMNVLLGAKNTIQNTGNLRLGFDVVSCYGCRMEMFKIEDTLPWLHNDNKISKFQNGNIFLHNNNNNFFYKMINVFYKMIMCSHKVIIHFKQMIIHFNKMITYFYKMIIFLQHNYKKDFLNLN